jgi:mRNA deadenylase 3'-5' endonuclease subunit Ccr4
MKKQKSKSPKNHTKKKSNKSATTLELPPSWVDDLDWLPVGEGCADGTDSDATTDSHDISILSWNVLADAYCTFRSHPHLPLKFQRHVFDRPQRQLHVRRTLKRLAPMADLMALQEVDSPLEVQECMQELGYQGLQTPTSAGGTVGRVDSCALYWNSQHYSCIEHEIVRFDDIAIMCTKSGETTEGAPTSRTTTMTNLSGVQSSFCRKNMGLLVRLQHEPSKQEIVVAVVHLYWNPVFEYVKVRTIWSMRALSVFVWRLE